MHLSALSPANIIPFFSEISNAAERVTYRELKYCFRQYMLWLTTYTGPPAEKLSGILQGEKL